MFLLKLLCSRFCWWSRRLLVLFFKMLRICSFRLKRRRSVWVGYLMIMEWILFFVFMRFCLRIVEFRLFLIFYMIDMVLLCYFFGLSLSWLRFYGLMMFNENMILIMLLKFFLIWVWVVSSRFGIRRLSLVWVSWFLWLRKLNSLWMEIMLVVYLLIFWLRLVLIWKRLNKSWRLLRFRIFFIRLFCLLLRRGLMSWWSWSFFLRSKLCWFLRGKRCFIGFLRMVCFVCLSMRCCILLFWLICLCWVIWVSSMSMWFWICFVWFLRLLSMVLRVRNVLRWCGWYGVVVLFVMIGRLLIRLRIRVMRCSWCCWVIWLFIMFFLLFMSRVSCLFVRDWIIC